MIIQVDGFKKRSSALGSSSPTLQEEEQGEESKDTRSEHSLKIRKESQSAGVSSSPPLYHLKILPHTRKISIQPAHRGSSIPPQNLQAKHTATPPSSQHLSSSSSSPPTTGAGSALRHQASSLPSCVASSAAPRCLPGEAEKPAEQPRLSSLSVPTGEPTPSSSSSSRSSSSSSASLLDQAPLNAFLPFSGALPRQEHSTKSPGHLACTQAQPSAPHVEQFLQACRTTSTRVAALPNSEREREERGGGRGREGGAGGGSGLSHLPGWARGEDGTCGGKAHRPGRRGKDAVLTVPPGCVVWEVFFEGTEKERGMEKEEEAEESGDCLEEESDSASLIGTRAERAPYASCLTSRACRRRVFLADLSSPSSPPLIVARGGRGGRGNSMGEPHTAELGEPGEEKWIEIELKSMADVGLIGFPNAGKSSLLAALSRCSPRIAPFPFTTLSPNIGRLFFHGGDCISIADLPGLIENAHLNEGLGHAFLRHAERTALLAYVIDVSGQSSTEIVEEEEEEDGRGDPGKQKEEGEAERREHGKERSKRSRGGGGGEDDEEEEEEVEEDVWERRREKRSWLSGMPRIPGDPMETFFALFREVCMYSRTLASRPFVVIATKCDLHPEKSLLSVDQFWKQLNSPRVRRKLERFVKEEKEEKGCHDVNSDQDGKSEDRERGVLQSALLASSKMREPLKGMLTRRMARNTGQLPEEGGGTFPEAAEGKRREREAETDGSCRRKAESQAVDCVVDESPQTTKGWPGGAPRLEVIPVSARCGFGLEYLAESFRKQLKDNEKDREKILKSQVEEWIRRGRV